MFNQTAVWEFRAGHTCRTPQPSNGSATASVEQANLSDGDGWNKAVCRSLKKAPLTTANTTKPGSRGATTQALLRCRPLRQQQQKELRGSGTSSGTLVIVGDTHMDLCQWTVAPGSAGREGGWGCQPVCSWPSWCWPWQTPASKSEGSLDQTGPPERTERPVKWAFTAFLTNI